MQLKFNIELTKSQKTAYDLIHKDGIKFITLCWPRQSGKSTLMEVLVLEWLLTAKNQRIAYVCKSYLLARKVFKEVRQLIPDDFIATANGSDLTIEATNGSTVQFFSAESGNALRGNTFNYLVADEFSFFKNELTDGGDLWNDVLSPTVKVRGRKVVFVSTPLGRGNLFYEMYKRGNDDEFPDYASYRTTIYDDDLSTPEEIERIRKSIPVRSFEQEYMTMFLDDAVTFFSGYEDCRSDFSYEDRGRVYMGIDFSSEGADRTVVTKINADGQVWQENVTGSLDERYYRIAKIINGTDGLFRCLYETNSIGLPMSNQIEKLLDSDKKRRFLPFTTTNGTKDIIISKLAVDISKKELKFNDERLMDELSNFRCTYSKTGRPTYAGAFGSHDDFVMSLAIANRDRGSSQRNGSIAFARAKFDELN